MPHRNPILLLSPEVITTIAAGEVIEQPSTVIKELIENALDAGATQITILLEDGGKQRIVLTDNGLGIAGNELEIAVKPHTTSKFRQLEDFAQLYSYGFRGEALASIGAVSQLKLRSRPAESVAGAEIEVEFGQLGRPHPVGMAFGTQVTVQSLFGQLPARQKFLRTAAQERQAILEMVTQLAVTMPEVGFTVHEAEQLLLHFPTQQTVLERVLEVSGQSSAEYWWPIDFSEQKIRVLGLLGSPQLARRSQPFQLFAVNRRSIKPTLISQSVRRAYGSSLEHRSQPAFAIFIEIAPAEVDINVHPRKEIVQWQDEAMIQHAITAAVTQLLSQKYIPSNVPELMINDSGKETAQFPSLKTLPLLHQTLRQQTQPWYHALATRARTILQVHHTYLITENAAGLLMVDQHAAHERLLYQQFVELFQTELAQQEQVKLEQPFLLRLSPSMSQLLTEHLETFQQLGYEVNTFGTNTFNITAVPKLLQERSSQHIFESVLSDIRQGIAVPEVEQFTHRTLAYLACRSAIKAGDPITEEQAQILLEKLEKTPYAFSCPHGRPTIHSISWKEMEKLFHRR